MRVDGDGDVDSDVDVAIVGFGPTGAVLAERCGALGLRTVVFERSDAANSEPRAVHLDAEIARLLQQCGLGDELHDLLTVSAGMEYVAADGRHLFTFEGFEREPLLGWHEDYVFHQPDLERALRTAAARHDSVEIRLGEPAPPVDELRAEPGHRGARFVVACDGASSSVRDQLGIGLVDLGFDEDWLVVDLVERRDGVGPPGRVIRQVCDPERLATYVPGHGPHHRFEFRLHGDESPDAWELIEPWGFTPDAVELARAARYRFHALVAQRWRDDGVFLAGDAAHQLPPFMGQGLCSGARDAANLAWKLAAVVRGQAGDDLLDTYEAERRPHVEAVVEMSVQAGRLLADLADDVAGGREPRLPAPDAPDPTRWSRLPGLELGGTFPVGHLVPQPPRDDGCFDDHLGDGWVLVTADFEPRATWGHEAVLVRPDRYIAAAGSIEELSALAARWGAASPR